MKIIKLDAIESTNSFLKDLSHNSDTENYTVIVANKQTKGKGQQGNKWISEGFKNLTFSVFIKDLTIAIDYQKYLNFAISLAIFDVLKTKNIQQLRIKWPNDILSVNQKICGILIENTIANTQIKSTVVGIGLNVNQDKFTPNLPNVSSLKILTKKEYDLDYLLIDLINSIQKMIQILQAKNYELLEKKYLKNLYKKDVAAMFKSTDNYIFMGIIRGIAVSGNIIIELESGLKKEFGIKEISFA